MVKILGWSEFGKTERRKSIYFAEVWHEPGYHSGVSMECQRNDETLLQERKVR